MRRLRGKIRTREEIAQMRKAGLLTWEAHQAAASLIRPGVSTAEINKAVEDYIVSHHAIPLFKGVPGEVPFPAGTCVSISNEVVHGIPGPRKLQVGDIVSIDIGVKLNGWCGDAAVTYTVGEVDPTKRKLIETTEGALRLAIGLVAVKQRWSQVAKEISRYVRKAGFSVAEDLTGHSIGREMWEGLYVPNESSPSYERHGDFDLEPGIVIAIEPIVNAGTSRLKTLKDHWTMVTEDGSPSAHFEHTIALTEAAPIILTSGPAGQGWAVG